MDRKVDIKRSVPPYLLEFREFNAVYTALNKEFQLLQESREKVLDQFFIDTMCEESILRMEKMLNILPDPAKEALEFRRDRVKNRFLVTPPFSVRYLRNQLDFAIGVGNYTLTIDNNNYTIYLESSALNQSWYEEIMFTVNKVKPCNMIFINNPSITDSIIISEQIEKSDLQYNYVLGSWKLGDFPVANSVNTKNIKGVEQMSLTKELLNKLAVYVSEQTKKVLVNDNVVISTFSMREAKEQNVTIEYIINSESIQSNEITNIKLLDSEDTVLTDANVYVPVTTDTLVKHTIKIKEGV